MASRVPSSGGLQIYLFRSSLQPFLALLDENGIEYQVKMPRPGAVIAAGVAVEVFHQAIDSVPMWGALATICVAYIKNRRSRKLIITTKDNDVIHAEGYSVEELRVLLENAKNFAAFDADKSDDRFKLEHDHVNEEP